MNNVNRGFVLNTVAALLYNGLAGLLVLSDPGRAYTYIVGLLFIAGIHLIALFLLALRQIRRFRPVGFMGYSILAVLLIHVIFWLLFINIP